MKCDNIILIAPKPLRTEGFFPLLGLCYLKSYIEARRNINVTILDISNYSIKNILKEIEVQQPITVGITSFSANRFVSIDIADKVKKANPAIPIVLGGIHASFLYGQIMKHFPFIDAVVCGEGEETFLDFIDSVQKNEQKETIKGLVFRRDGEVICNEKRPFIQNLDTLPFPHYIEHFERYNGARLRAASIITSRGCFGFCKFCSVPHYWGRTRFRSPQNVVEEISFLKERYRIGYVNFMDDTFTDDHNRVRQICDLIEKGSINLPWRATARANTITDELLSMMHKAGCVVVSVGIESGSQKILDRLGKNITVDKIREICDKIKKCHMTIESCLIVGSPGETEETINETKKLINQIKPEVFNISQSMYLLPGTAFTREFEKQGIYKDNLWLDRNVVNIKYLHEHDERCLSKWQIKLIKVAFKCLSLRKKIRYCSMVLQSIEPRQLFSSLYSYVAGSKIIFKHAASGRIRK